MYLYRITGRFADTRPPNVFPHSKHLAITSLVHCKCDGTVHLAQCKTSHDDVNDPYGSG